jgi:peroxiredoxin
MDGRPSVGDRAPWFAGVTDDGKVCTLDDLDGRVAVLVFHETLGSLRARSRLSALWSHRGQLERMNTALLVVTAETLERVRWHLTDVDVGWPVLADAHREAHRAYHVGRSAPLRAWLAGHLGGRGSAGHSGDVGADFVIDRSGTIAFAHRSGDAQPRPPAETLIHAATAASGRLTRAAG